MCIIQFDCLIVLYLFITLVPNTSFIIVKIVVSKKKSVMSKNTLQEYLAVEFALVHLTFGLCTSPTDTFPFTYHPFNGCGMCAVDNFQRLRFGNSRSPDKFTRKHKTQIIVYVYIYIAHHLRGQWHIPISQKVFT